MVRTCMKFLLVASALLMHAVTSLAQERVTVVGMVEDADGKPIANAIVAVLQARTKFGYSNYGAYYEDCGKWALTGPDGKYTFSGLDRSLVLTFVVGKSGYASLSTWNVDPAIAPDPITLRPRPALKDDSQTFHGRIVDAQGKPLKDALVQPWAGAISGPGGRVGKYVEGLQMYLEGLTDQVTLTNGNGEFELDAGRAFLEATVRVSVRGKAPRYFTVASGTDRKTLTMNDGATVRGRLVYDGKPVAAAGLRLISIQTAFASSVPDFRTKTAQDGTFVIADVPPNRIWLLSPTMESLAASGIGSDPLVCQVKSDREVINLGDVRLKPAHTLSGKIVLVDGKTLAGGKSTTVPMQVAVVADQVRDTQIVSIGYDGAFHLRGLPDGIYGVWPSIKGYRLVERCLICWSAEVVVKGDVDNMVLKMEPDPGDLPEK